MNILITGGAGYIGSHVAKQILKDSTHNLTVLDSLVTGFEETIDSLRTIREFDFVRLDLSEWDRVEEFFENRRFDALIHFAASLIVPESVENPIKYYLNNTANTTNLLKCCVKSGVKKFVFSSTAAVYGEPSVEAVGSGVSEEFLTMPINPYGQSKLFSEKIIQDFALANPSFKYVILRYFNVAGADPDGLIGQRTKNATHLIKVSLEAALGKREGVSIFGDDFPTNDGSGVRDYIHVSDLADAHIRSLEFLELNKSDIFNCGYGRGFSVKEVIDTVKKVSGVDFTVKTIGRRAGDPAMLVAQTSKIREKIGWKPRFDNLEFICNSAYEWEKKLI